MEGELKEEIPNSLSAGHTILIFDAADSYRYEVVGTDEGTYGINIVSVGEEEVTNVGVTEVPTSERVVHQYTISWDALRRGEPSISVQVDSDGDKTFEQTKIVQPPMASFIFSPISGVTNEEIDFDASESRDVDGEIVSYRWNFGDGSGSTSRTVTHAYSAPGAYTITLAVVDNDGVVSTHSKIIQVEERQEGLPTWFWVLIGIMAGFVIGYVAWRTIVSKHNPRKEAIELKL